MIPAPAVRDFDRFYADMMMENPVLVELFRGPLMESRHRGAVAVVDADGKVVLAFGDIDARIYPRSAIKALQALPLVESGAAEEYGFGDCELALSCASHGGEPGHVDVATRILKRAGCEASALECGAHWPTHRPSAFELARKSSAPSALHNSCSGKHLGFICLAKKMGVHYGNYSSAAHPVQQEVKHVLENVACVTLTEKHCGIDGCSVPSWAMPLRNLALAFARFGTGHALEPRRAKAAGRLRAACAAQPWHVGGTGRFCTDVMHLLGSRVFVKFGAEGVYCGTFPQQGLGIAVKCDDGAVRAAEIVMAAIIARFAKIDFNESAVLNRLINPPVMNWNGTVVGAMRAAHILRSVQ